MNFHYGASFSYLGFDLGNFGTGNDRLQSWFEEPSFMAYAMMPAIFVALSRLFNLHKNISKVKAILIIGILLLTKSSVGLLGLLFSLIIVVFSKYPIIKKPTYFIPLIITIPLLGFSIYQIPDVKLRVDDTYDLFSDDNVSKQDISKTNLSTYALYSNYRVTKKTFFNNVFLGTGIGTYESNYNKYINELIPATALRDRYQLNKKDANSLFMRLLAETGLAGIFLFFFFIQRNKIKFSSINLDKRFLWAFNNGIFVLIMLRLLRQGHYTSLGFIMFLLLFYFFKKEIVINERNN
ncbi:O-antigen ligase family protein [Aquimarina sp. 2201CG14-23]|uniref:O-antigen ligase family protein n=1 Tax=Aquimarina mycalae TaxID=3040073 RepID=UPI0024780322|nr:O-antigen ligase family protein [Aquimarina sp. 2201CG14-23]MDH7446367.1 O-antigen ligase family protein [Aquimarina sp. 2201CG14-23]